MAVTAASGTRCWCGAAVDAAVGAFYRRCPRCGTAVRSPKPRPAHFDVADDARDFYGRAYWTSYARGRALPGIEARARADLAERCVHWLERVLEVSRPPGRFLEIGCGHGAFVALMREAGWDAVGTELSPWVVDFARRTWDVRVVQGRGAHLALEPGFRCIAAFDVVEHLEDPVAELARLVALLADDGVLVLQTPWYRGEGPDWPMFQEDEHVHLFTADAVRAWLRGAGLVEVLVRPGLFPYDMLVVASRRRFALDAAAGAARGGPWRPPALVRALLDVARERQDARDAGADTARDSAARLDQVRALGAALRAAEAESLARLEQLHALDAMVRTSEAERLEQVRALEGQLRAVEAELSAQVERLTGALAESEADRLARLGQIHELTALLRESEADRAARLEVIRALEAQLDAIQRTAVWRVYQRVRAAGGRRAG